MKNDQESKLNLARIYTLLVGGMLVVLLFVVGIMETEAKPGYFPPSDNRIIYESVNEPAIRAEHGKPVNVLLRNYNYIHGSSGKIILFQPDIGKHSFGNFVTKICTMMKTNNHKITSLIVHSPMVGDEVLSGIHTRTCK